MEGIVGQPRYLNPILSSVNTVDEDLTSVIYAGLLGYDDDGRLVNRLAESVEVSDDGLIYVVRLREGLLWHDGEPVTAADVAFTVGVIMDPAYRSPLRQSWQGVSVEVRDDRTVAFVQKKAYAGFRDRLTVGVLPKHIWESISPDRFSLADANLFPVGCGPYSFSDIRKDSVGNVVSYELRAFPEYFGGEPYITKLGFSFYPDSEAMTAAYERKEIMGMSPLSSDRGESFVGKKGTDVRIFHLPRIFAVFLNPVKSIPLGYDEVRQALSMATDRDAIVRDILSGNGVATAVPFFSFMEGSPTVPSVSYDVAAANVLLDEKGWVRNGDGIREKDGAKISFTLMVPDWPEARETAELLRDQWSLIGAEVSVRAVSTAELNRDNIRPREYEALLYGEEMRVDPDFYSFWHSAEKDDPGLNYAMFADSEADDILLRLREETDLSKRNGLVGSFLGILSAKNPAVFLYGPDVFYVVSDDVKGWSVRTANKASSRFSGIGTWYVGTKRVWSGA